MQLRRVGGRLGNGQLSVTDIQVALEVNIRLASIDPPQQQLVCRLEGQTQKRLQTLVVHVLQFDLAVRQSHRTRDGIVVDGDGFIEIRVEDGNACPQGKSVTHSISQRWRQRNTGKHYLLRPIATDEVVTIVHPTPRWSCDGKPDTGSIIQHFYSEEAWDSRDITCVTSVLTTGLRNGGIEFYIRYKHLHAAHNAVLLEPGHTRRVSEGGIGAKVIGSVSHPGGTQAAGEEQPANSATKTTIDVYVFILIFRMC